MSIQEFKSKVNGIMDVIWAGGLTNHTAVIELMIYIIFLRELHKHDQEQKMLDKKYEPVLSGDLSIYQWDNILSLNADALFVHLGDAFEKLSQQSNNQTVKLLYNKAHIKLFAKPALRTVVHKIEELMKEIENEEKIDRSDMFGDLYEYLLSSISSAGTGGQFRTPRHIIKFMVDVIDPEVEESICDPACGTGGFLVAALEHLKRKYTSEDFKKENKYPMDKLTEKQRKFLYNQAFTGFDSDPDMIKFGLMNLYFHKLENATVKRRNSLVDTQGETTKWDIILANPPFAGKIDRDSVAEELQMETGATEVLFLNYMIRHLSDRGRCAVIVPEGVIFQAAKAHKAIREKLVSDAGLWAVASLPNGVFNPYAGVKTSILFFDKTKKETNTEIAFIKIANDGFDLGAQRRPHDKNDIPRVTEILKTWRNGEKIESPIVVYVEKEKIAENGEYNLLVDRYRVVTDYSNAKWPMVKLGEICEFIGKGGRPASFATENGKIPFIVSSLFEKKCDSADFDVEALIIGDGGSANIHYINGRFSASDHTYVLKNKNEESVSLRYVYLLILNNLEIIEEGFQGQGLKNVSKKHLQSIQIPLPPLEIQEQITAELEGYANIIAGAKQIAQNWKPKIDIDPEWDKVKLEKVGKIRMCKRIFKGQTNVDGDIPFYKIGTFGKTPNAFISQEIFNDYKTRFSYPKKGAVLISTSGTIGRTVVFDGEPAYFQDSNIVWIENDEKRAYNKYLNLVFQDIDWTTTKGGTIERLYNKLIEEQVISIPPLKIQKQIVEKIETERALVESAKKLIGIYEEKNREVIGKLWGK